MKLKYGLADESYKSWYGVDYIGKDEWVFKNKRISLISAKRDWVAFQVMLKGDEEFSLSTGSNPYFSPRGPLSNIRLKVAVDELNEAAVKVYPVGFVEDDDRIHKADILLKHEVVHVQGNRTQPVWVEIGVPEGVKPGKYKGRVEIYLHSMFEDEQRAGVLDFDIIVKDVLMPTPDEYKFHLDLWQHLSNIARKHEVSLWSNEHFNIIERYVESLAHLGQKAVTVIVSEIPWSGQRCFRVTNYLSDMFEYSMVRVEKMENGEFHYDFSVMERYIKLCFKYGIDREIEVFGLTNIWVSPEEGYEGVAQDYPDAIRVRYLDRSDNCFKYMKSREEINKYVKALEQYFIGKGWISKVLVVADEPADVELYRKRLNNLRETAPSFRYKTAINHIGFMEDFKDEIQDFVPIFPCICQEWELVKKIRKDIKGRFLWYVCCWPLIPNTFICSNLLESRIIGILTAYMEFDGFLRWNYTVWPERPRERISFRYPGWRAGDTNFVYPANDGGPLLTLRYKNLKRGIEDFELIQRVRSVCPEGNEVLEDVWKKLLIERDITGFHPSKNKKAGELFSLDYNDYQDVKAALLDAIAQSKAPWQQADGAR